MESKSINDILAIKLKLYSNVLVTDGNVMSLSDIIEKPHGLKSIKVFRERVAKMSYSEKKLLKEELRPNLPCFTPSGLFGKNKSVSELIAYSNIISIDIDPLNGKGEGNSKETMEKVPEILRYNPFVFYFNKSLSNNGYYALVMVDGSIEDYYTHYQALKEDFILKGIQLDKNAVKLTQPRFLTLPEEGILKGRYEIYTRKSLIKEEKTYKVLKCESKNHINESKSFDPKSLEKIEKIVEAVEIEKLNIAFDHKANFEMRCIIKNIAGLTDKGFELYERIMKFRPDYTDFEIVDKWNANEKYSNFTLGTAYFYLEEARRKKIIENVNKKLLIR